MTIYLFSNSETNLSGSDSEHDEKTHRRIISPGRCSSTLSLTINRVASMHRKFHRTIHPCHFQDRMYSVLFHIHRVPV
jgi:hypothetical protein